MERIALNIRLIRNYAIMCLCGFWVLLLVSCSSEFENEMDAVSRPIEFVFELPGDGVVPTRAKTAFSNNDKIYITARVTKKDAAVVTTSTVMVYNSSGSWMPEGGNWLKWPLDAESATFVAYYLPVAGVPATGSPVSIDFSNILESTDDVLLAERNTIHLNGVVTLQFAHTMTKLRVGGLKTDATTVTLQSNYPITNRVVVSYNDNDGYTHEFVNKDVSQISLTKGTGATEVVFFLNVTDDWNGKTFNLVQTDAGNIDLVNTSFTNQDLHTMKRGRAYYISFYSGSKNLALEEAEKWFTEPAPRVFDTEQDIVDYFGAIGPGGLTEDLDLNNILLTDGMAVFSRSTRGVTLTNDFNGNYYTIRNVYVMNGLFDNIPSGMTVKNLRLENVKVQAEGGEAAGMLAPVNNGTIDNVRIGGNCNIGTDGVWYVGGLVGKNMGTISNVSISGTLTMDCYLSSNETNRFFSVGGMAGTNGVDKAGSYSIKNSEIVAGTLITAAGQVAGTDGCIGGFVGYNAISKTVDNCMAHVHVDASQLSSLNSYAGGFCGTNRGALTKNDASGDVTGGHFTERASTGGFVGYTTSLTEKTLVATVNGCAATGAVTETDGTGNELYTGGFAGFSTIDLYNTSSTGKITKLSSFGGVWKVGALTGLISADKTIYNSFSISTLLNGSDLPFNGEETSKTENSHYKGKMLNGEGEVTATVAHAELLNNAVGGNNYWEWSSSTSVYGGVAYLIKP